MDPDKSASTNEIQPEGLNHLDITALLGEERIDWDLIKKKLSANPAQFEELLFRIHFKRNKPLQEEQRSRLLQFLAAGYLTTNDVRYFNELLWFYRSGRIDMPLMDACMERFNTNLNPKGYHCLPGRFDQYPVETISSATDQDKYNTAAPLRICLIGFPPFFGSIIKNLKKEGHHVEQFFLPYHPNRNINRFLKLRVPVKILSLLSGNTYAYRTLDYDHKDERIGQVLREGNFDIGFHKLNLIIKNNIFGAFKKGLLNDHWGYLPLLRGKSTIAWSVLLSIPVIPTVHFINKGIDSGPIAGYYPCDYHSAKSVKEIRHIIKKTMPERVIAAINKAGGNGFVSKENKTEDGITFYEIHPWLSNHINSCILKK